MNDCFRQSNIKWLELIDVDFIKNTDRSWVYTALYKGEKVIVKTINPESNDDFLLKDLESEMKILSKIDHVNILKIYGSGIDKNGKPFIVLEYLEGGDLSRILKEKCLDIQNALRYALSIASALNHCHFGDEKNIVIHRDVKLENIGLAKDGEVKLIDFGLAIAMERSLFSTEKVHELSGGVGSIRYMCPEVSKENPYNQKADVYSFSIVLWELLSGKKAFSRVCKDEFYRRVVENNERPPLKKHWPEELTNLMEKCWSKRIQDRPDFPEIIDILDSLLRDNRLRKRKSSLTRFTAQMKKIRRTSFTHLYALTGFTSKLLKRNSTTPICV